MVFMNNLKKLIFNQFEYTIKSLFIIYKISKQFRILIIEV